MKNAIRLSALMKLRVIYIFTHDSIGVGEDGPTHQPIEQLAALRTIPGLNVIRPADGNETIYAFISALNFDGPTAIVLTRQNLPQCTSLDGQAIKGGYVISKGAKETADCLIVSNGSELNVCLQAQKLLAEQHSVSANVVSMPSIEIFQRQSEEYKNTVLPEGIARVCVEAASSLPWYQFIGEKGTVIGIDKFGESAKAEILFEDYGFTPENVCKQVLKLVKR